MPGRTTAVRLNMPETQQIGTATALQPTSPTVRTDGPCLIGTLDALESGIGARPMHPDAIAKVKSDALSLLELVVTTYASEIAPNEVGASGSAQAGGTGACSCTGLLYGRIQSGKTVAMIGLIAAAIDNGFRVVVVLTSDNVKLVRQTTERFGALQGPIAIDALNPAMWSNDDKHISRHLARNGVVFVCSKNKDRLDALIEFLKRIGAPQYPGLVLDDEADQATLDTNTAKRHRQRENGGPDVDKTAIHSRVVEHLCATLRHHVFLQVTATPYALLLQSVGTTLRPSFTRLLEPGEGYTGGESFFESEHLDGPNPPLVYVDTRESTSLGTATEAPEGLQRAIAFFLISAAAQSLRDAGTARHGQNFLCHTSRLRIDHRHLESLVRAYVDRISDDLDRGDGAGIVRLHSAHAELAKTVPLCPPIDELLAQVTRRLVGRKIVVVNAEAEAEYGRGLNLIIGGNILGRGVTIDNLLVTYYLREPKVGQMDTMLQHARMYGYRQKLMPYTRVFLPRQLAVRFHEIHRIEGRLRRQLRSTTLDGPIVIEKSAGLYPTRRGVLDPEFIDAFAAEDQVFPYYPLISMQSERYQSIAIELQRLVGGSLSTEAQQAQITIDDAIKLVDLIPYDDSQQSSSWIPGLLRRVLEAQRQRCQGSAFLFTRRMQRQRDTLTTGALSGDELRRLRTLNRPVFCAFRDDGKKIAGANAFWYPTLVFDSGMPNVVVNVTEDGS